MDVKSVADPSSLPIITPAFYLSCAGTLACGYVLSPLLANSILPKAQVQKMGHKRMYFNNILGSGTFAGMLALMAAYSLFSGDMIRDKMFAVSPAAITTLNVTLGFHVGDLIMRLLDPYLRTYPSLIIHHFLIIFGTLVMLYSHEGIYWCTVRLLPEIFIVVLFWRGMLHEVGNRNGYCYIFATLLMVSTFFFSRLASLPFLYSDIVYNSILLLPQPIPLSAAQLILFVDIVLLDLLNVYWLSLMAKLPYRVLFSKKVSTE